MKNINDNDFLTRMLSCLLSKLTFEAVVPKDHVVAVVDQLLEEAVQRIHLWLVVHQKHNDRKVLRSWVGKTARYYTESMALFELLVDMRLTSFADIELVQVNSLVQHRQDVAVRSLLVVDNFLTADKLLTDRIVQAVDNLMNSSLDSLMAASKQILN